MKSLVIEKLSKSNFDNFVYLIKKLAEYERLEPPDKEAVKRLKKDGLSKKPKFEAYLAKIGEEYVGYLIFYMAYSSFLGMPTLFLEDTFVVEEYRKHGVGQKIFDFVKGQVRKRGYRRLDFCIIEWNKPAIEFAEKNKAKKLNWLYYRLELK